VWLLPPRSEYNGALRSRRAQSERRISCAKYLIFNAFRYRNLVVASTQRMRPRELQALLEVRHPERVRGNYAGGCASNQTQFLRGSCPLVPCNVIVRETADGQRVSTQCYGIRSTLGDTRNASDSDSARRRTGVRTRTVAEQNRFPDHKLCSGARHRDPPKCWKGDWRVVARTECAPGQVPRSARVSYKPAWPIMTAFRTPAEAWEYRNFDGGIQP
jgi:hypothetical protein